MAEPEFSLLPEPRLPPTAWPLAQRAAEHGGGTQGGLSPVPNSSWRRGKDFTQGGGFFPDLRGLIHRIRGGLSLRAW